MVWGAVADQLQAKPLCSAGSLGTLPSLFASGSRFALPVESFLDWRKEKGLPLGLLPLPER